MFIKWLSLFRRCFQSARMVQHGRKQVTFERLEDRCLLAVVTVDTDIDVVDFEDGVTSLREAIFATNLVSGADTIDFDASLDGGTITLLLGELTITDELTIDASNLTIGFTIDASGGSRIFSIDDSTAALIDVELKGLTLTGGVETVNGKGGAISSVENLTVRDSLLAGNSASLRGGGIWATGTVTIVDSVITDNLSDLGGGMFVNGSTSITGSTVSDNWANIDGGGIRANVGDLTIHESTISGNTAQGYGGGIWSYQMTTLTDSIISDNYSSYEGGGLWAKSATTIAGGTISGNKSLTNGGGVYANGNLDIDSVTISGNMAEFSGGGINAQAPMSMIGSSILNNTAIIFDGGGIFVQSSTNIHDCSFVGNIAGDDGGGIFHSSGDFITSLSTFTGNMANDEGGGIRANSPTIVSITDSTLSGNATEGDGGGARISGGDDVTITLSKNTVFGNSAENRGGGFFIDSDGNTPSATTTISDSMISGNLAGLSGGGINIYAKGISTIIGNTISGNTANRGGGIYALKTDTITNSTISGNLANENGGGIYSLDMFAISHSTISENVADADTSLGGAGGGIAGPFFGSTLDHTIVAGNYRGIATRDDIAASIAATYSIIGDDTGATITDNGGNQIGTGIAPIDPRLAPLDDNGGPTKTHGLLFGSPALDAGNLGFSPPPNFDQRGTGFDRIVDNGAGAIIDMGAYEAQSAPLEADLNLDGFVDALDFANLASHFGPTNGGYAIGNLNGDAFVDAADISIMFSNWTGDAVQTATILISSIVTFQANRSIDSLVGISVLPASNSAVSQQASIAAINEKQHQDLQLVDALQQVGQSRVLAVANAEATLGEVAQAASSQVDESAFDAALLSLTQEDEWFGV